MKLYKADKFYIDFLRQKDSKVMDNKDPQIRPYWFFEIELDGQKFAIPLSSPKDANSVRFNPFTMINVKQNSEELGRLYLLNMIPFDSRLFTPVDKLKEQYDDKYMNLLFKQESELTKQSQVIANKAKNVFNARYDEKHKKHSMLQMNSCDFKMCIQLMNELTEGLNKDKSVEEKDSKKSFKEKLAKATEIVEKKEILSEAKNKGNEQER